jgi:hypothetical protein
MRTITVHLAGGVYEITERRSRENAAWREKLRGPFGALVDRLENVGDTDVTSMRDVVALIRETAGTLLASPDILADLVFEYAPALAADKERLLEESYDSELMAAFLEVVQLAFPFGGILGRLKGLADLGRSKQTTTPS